MYTGPYINYHCLACFGLLARSHTPRDIWKHKLISIPETLSLWSLKVLSIFLSLYFFLSRTFLLVLLNSLSLSLTHSFSFSLSPSHTLRIKKALFLSFFLSLFHALSRTQSLSDTWKQFPLSHSFVRVSPSLCIANCTGLSAPYTSSSSLNHSLIASSFIRARVCDGEKAF